MSWHTKHRPKAVQDLHLTDVRELLLKVMESGSFPQVFLNAGPKGTGKTSTARIIAAMLNDPQNEKTVQGLFSSKTNANNSLKEPDPASDVSQSIFSGESFIVNEMDAASNRGIDDIRSLKEQVALPPQGATVSVYILDEVHMLTKEAFNALLKLLEEPPSHAVFILATTELHKVPDTVQSRCLILPFRKGTLEEIIQALQTVAKKEKVTVSDEVLKLLAEIADGSFRDAIKNLEMVVNVAGKDAAVTVEDVEQVLHTGFLNMLPELIDSVISKDSTKVAKILDSLRQQGVTTNVLHQALLSHLHQDMLKSLEVISGNARYATRVAHYLLDQLQRLDTIAVETVPLLSIELKLLEMIFKAEDKASGGSGGRQKSTSSAPDNRKSRAKESSQSTSQQTVTDTIISESIVEDHKTQKTKAITAVPTNHNKTSSATTLTHQNISQVDDHVDTRPLLDAWSSFVSAVEQKNTTIAALLRSAKPDKEKSNGVAHIQVFYAFHKEQLMQPRFQQLLKECAQPILGVSPGFHFELAARDEMSTVRDSSKSSTTGDTVSETSSQTLADVASAVLT